MQIPCGVRLACVVTIAVVHYALPAEAGGPQVLDQGLKLELFAEQPDIVTPIGAVFDRKGRLLVIESHTHQRAKNKSYKGPQKDRIRIVEDTNGDGKADRFRTFYAGTEATMSLARGPGDWIYVATRMMVFRIRDTNGDDKADERQTLVHLETKANYPHNGLCGLALDGKGNLYFGMGENLGAAYRMMGSDGALQAGSGEGGVFRCDLQGKGLSRVATGFWNPFGICIDVHGRVFAVGNDPDQAPPCRLVHVVETGDYGFQFKYGRSGRHPLQAWNGELPGTLPMVAGTGEAPGEVAVFQGRLWVAVWGDNRIERFQLQPSGASFKARRKVVVQGDKMFRPVAFAQSPDGSIYFTDWVDRSYPVHGKGRIWRLSCQRNVESHAVPAFSDTEKKARDLATKADWDALKTDDLFLRQAAVAGIVRTANLEAVQYDLLKDARQRLGFLQALRWKLDQSVAVAAEVPTELLAQALADNDPQVRLYAVRWVADAGVRVLRSKVEQQLRHGLAPTPELFKASVVTLDLLDKQKSVFISKKGDAAELFARMLRDETKPAVLRTLALRMITPADQSIQEPLLRSLLASGDLDLRRETVRWLTVSMLPERNKLLKEVLDNKGLPEQMRADALLGLARDAKQQTEWINKLAAGGKGLLGRQAARIKQRLDGKVETFVHAPADKIDQWMKQVGTGGDADAGWRVFYGAAGVRCADCHRFQQRGARTGPDLTSIAANTSRRDVLESLLSPSRDIAPQYVPETIVTIDGKIRQGLYGGEVKKQNVRLLRFQASDGTTFLIDPAQVESRRPSKVSIMPEGLHKQLSLEDIRNLLALLSGGAEK